MCVCVRVTWRCFRTVCRSRCHQSDQWSHLKPLTSRSRWLLPPFPTVCVCVSEGGWVCVKLKRPKKRFKRMCLKGFLNLSSHCFLFSDFFVSICRQVICKFCKMKYPQRLKYMQAVRQNQAHANPKGGATSKHKDTPANQKLEQK